jgi:hypothetical protein
MLVFINLCHDHAYIKSIILRITNILLFKSNFTLFLLLSLHWMLAALLLWLLIVNSLELSYNKMSKWCFKLMFGLVEVWYMRVMAWSHEHHICIPVFQPLHLTTTRESHFHTNVNLNLYNLLLCIADSLLRLWYYKHLSQDRLIINYRIVYQSS